MRTPTVPSFALATVRMEKSAFYVDHRAANGVHYASTSPPLPIWTHGFVARSDRYDTMGQAHRALTSQGFVRIEMKKGATTKGVVSVWIAE